nr:hypothetical protein [uncultured Butyrivibrio sp.]
MRENDTLYDELKNVENLSEYTPIPFWFWNDDLSEEEILRQMKEMKDKGVDGLVIHPRKGLPRSIEYLSDEYFHFVKFAVQKAKEMDMKVVLYDEAMYPSGSCHGEVVKGNPDFASKGLTRNLKIVPSEGTIRGVHENEDDGEGNAPKSADLLYPEAVARFIELTHDKYYAELSEYFGDTIIAFFTDEPNILGRNCRADIIPWSEGIMEEYEAAGGKKENLKFLFEDNCEDQETKSIYSAVIHERLSNSYYSQLSKWCIEHNIALTGHPEKSTDIGYLKYFQMPCQDIVWRFVEPEDDHSIVGEHSTMGKCSSDSARHRGKRRNGNECFGCCGERQDPYLFTENDMRWYLNWLFIRGVNLVYPHAFYYSIRDGRGEERPPEVGLHNPFWPDYKRMSDYIKRMCFLNTDSVNQAQVAIICSEDQLSWKLAKPLFTHQIEFNYLEKELFIDCDKEHLTIASQKYSVTVIDITLFEALNQDQRQKLNEFASVGGKLIILDENDFSEDDYLKEINNYIDKKVSFIGDVYYLRTTQLKKDNEEFILLSNEKEESISFQMKLIDYDVKYAIDPYTMKEIDLVGEITMKPYDLYLVCLKDKN